MWMATREQLKKMAANKACDYLEFDESSTNGIPEMHSGSIQMFLPECGFIKVLYPNPRACVNEGTDEKRQLLHDNPRSFLPHDAIPSGGVFFAGTQ